MITDQADHMSRALQLAAKGRLHVSPNPQVGCVIVKDGQVVGEGFHRKYGDKHAEINALQAAGKDACGAEMYVTLEPCCHHGKTPPCTEAILQAGVRKVFVAMQDPHPLVSGKGITMLRQNGIEVEIGLLEKQARKLNCKFLHFIKHKTPYVSLKIATTLDGKITRTDGEQWITNQKSLAKVHELRSEYDAILVGKNTVLQDNPSLTTYRLQGGRNPLRVILDSHLELPLNKKVFADSNFLIVTLQNHSSAKKQSYFNKGGQLIELPDFISKLSTLNSKLATECECHLPTGDHRKANKRSLLSLQSLLKELGQLGVSSLLVEGGSQVFTSFLNQNLAQQIYWFQAPILTGTGALDSLGTLNKLRFLKTFKVENLGDNVLIQGDISSNQAGR